jgi:hypothetical protein
MTMTQASGTAEGVAHDDEAEVALESGLVVAPLVVAHDREEVGGSEIRLDKKVVFFWRRSQ